ncbi:phosphoadenosine phosphosulfate reductase family protein [Flavobacteriaceae bacterium]|nr:phosphoadenosine phosphosulfate reductase family protein [Flavobacteriaceae bacterium]
MNIESINNNLKDKSPEERIKWALSHAKRPIITTNFRPYEAAIIHLVAGARKEIPVIWCDSGYNTRETYLHADELIERFNLNIDLFVPKQTTAYRDVYLGVPSVDDPKHEQFTHEVKIEPFLRAFEKHQPDFWFTNLRKGQTALRDGLGIVSEGKNGVIKFSPFYEYSDIELDEYLQTHDLPNEFKYFDPTKVESNRECGLHKTL